MVSFEGRVVQELMVFNLDYPNMLCNLNLGFEKYTQILKGFVLRSHLKVDLANMLMMIYCCLICLSTATATAIATATTITTNNYS